MFAVFSAPFTDLIGAPLTLPRFLHANPPLSPRWATTPSPIAPCSIATGLVEIAARSVDLEDKLNVWKDLPNIVFAPHAGAETLMARFLKRSPRCALTLANFPRLERNTAAAVGLLRAALNHTNW